MGGGTGRVDVALWRGAVAAMMSRQLAAGVLQPVLQLVDAPRLVLATTSPPPRYRMTLSDGAHLQPAVLATSLNGLVNGGELRRGTVIRVLEYISGVIQKQRFVLVIQLEILHAEFALIGNPTIYEDNATQHFDVKMQQLSLKDHQNERFALNATGYAFVPSEGGEVRATCFNSQAEQYFDLIEVDKVYLISEGSLRPAQKKFNSLNNDYEILLDHRTSIEICCGVETSFIMQQYNFRQISEIENMEIGAFVDLVGVVTAVGPSAMLMRKDGTRAQKRPVQLKDLSGRSVEIVFWGKFCDAEGHQLQLLSDSGSNPVLAVKGGRISDFSGRSVVTISSTRLKVNPDLPVAEGLKQWYMAGGKTAPCVSLSQDTSSDNSIYVQKTISQIKDENLGQSDKPDFITVRAVILNVLTDKFCYPACTLELNGIRCYRKVYDNGTCFCVRSRITGIAYATAFQEAAEEIVGHTAQELIVIRDVERDHLKFAAIMGKVVSRECLFKLRIKAETFNDEQRVKCTIVGVEKLDAADRNDNLLENIDNLWNVLKEDLSNTPDVSYANQAGHWTKGCFV
ncbi:hypothetical protein HU200_020184 [Digitaria exilis]|uniref:Replication protein A subunit n=1 Tax=Digitaria exilis TaxID=1010633 RepID=A0A835F1F5_9POAL|nr:hypothetical protein HU200_020184 [Digitaria exilis]